MFAMAYSKLHLLPPLSTLFVCVFGCLLTASLAKSAKKKFHNYALASMQETVNSILVMISVA